MKSIFPKVTKNIVFHNKSLVVTILFVVSILFYSLSDIAIFYPTYVYRYKMTIHLEANGRPLSGNGVFEVSSRPGPKFIRDINYGGEAPRVKGEAILIALSPRRAFVLTLRPNEGHGPGGTAMEAFTSSTPGTDAGRIELLKKLEGLNASAHLPPSSLWQAVILDDRDDPATMQSLRIYPSGETNEPGIQVTGVEIEMTKADITVGIEDKLHWLSSFHPGSSIGVAGKLHGLAMSLDDFKLGLK